MTKRGSIILLLLCFFGFKMDGQTLKAFEKAAAKAIASEDYYSAMVYLANAMEIEPENPRLFYQYAEVCLEFNAPEIAETYYTKIIENGDAKQFPLAIYWLGITKKNLGKYQEANELFQAYLKTPSANKGFIELAKNQIKDCQWAINLEPNKLLQTTITHLDKKVNTPYSEFGGIESESVLYYTSHRFKNKEDRHDPPRNISKNLYAKPNSKGRPMKRGFNPAEKLTAHTAFSTDGSRIYFTICNYLNSAKIHCELFYRERDSRNRWKKKWKKLPKTINEEGTTTTHPAIGFDSLLQKDILYFVSDRTGGQGGLDIWSSSVEEKSFGDPVNLFKINTPKDDLTPFFHNVSQTLFFSSDGRQNLGGYDIYKSNKKEDWSTPEHLGTPLNSSYNDLYFTINAKEEKGYFSSNRPGSFYLDKTNKTCCYDIYQANFQEIIPISVDSGDVVIELPQPKPIVPSIPPTPTKLEDFLPLALYFHNDEPDRRTRRTTTKKTYEASYLKYYALKQEYLSEYTKPLNEEDAFDAENRLDDFFEDQVRKGYDHLFLFSNILLKRLEAGETVEIFIKGYTSPRAKGDYNLRLGKRRISSLRNHFLNYKNQIFAPYFDNGQLKVTERSFGETTASTAISDDLTDKRNSIYSVEAARERRVEIVEITRE